MDQDSAGNPGRLRHAAVLLGLVLLSHISAQAPSGTNPAFEVATIKPSKPDTRDSSLNFSPGYFRTSNVPLSAIIKFAYNLSSGSDDQLVGGPSWIQSSRFDVDAKEDEALAQRLEKMPWEDRAPIVRRMIQGLLEERFYLKVHNELRDRTVDSLVVEKGDPRLRTSTEPSTTEGARSASPEGWKGLHNNGNGEIEGREATLDMLANMLALQPEIGGRLVVDNTGLQGKYNFTLKWTPDRDSGAPSTGGNLDAAGPSLFSALREQLGLKLESRRIPVTILVIDHIEKPSEN